MATEGVLEPCLQQAGCGQPGALTPLPVELPATHARPQRRGLQPDTAQGLGLSAARVCGERQGRKGGCACQVLTSSFHALICVMLSLLQNDEGASLFH